MVPTGYDAYFATVATAAAALIGLLFVAVSQRDETIFGIDARPGGEALAITAFTGLVNSFTVSLLAVLPTGRIGVAATVLAVLSIVTILRLHSRLHAARNLTVLVITMVVYAIQLSYGITLIISPHSSGRLADLAYVLFATLLVSLQRAWALLRGTELRQAAGASATAGPSGEQGAAG
jgi:hypothetical protein